MSENIAESKVQELLKNADPQLLKETAIVGIQKIIVSLEALDLLFKLYGPFSEESNSKVREQVALFRTALDEVALVELRLALEELGKKL